MIALLFFLVTLFASPLKSRSRLEAENAALRYQLIVLRRKVPGRVRVTNGDRLVFIQLYRWFPSVLKVIMVIRPETLLRWHRAGFRRYWCWKSRPFGGRHARARVDTRTRRFCLTTLVATSRILKRLFGSVPGHWPAAKEVHADRDRHSSMGYRLVVGMEACARGHY